MTTITVSSESEMRAAFETLSNSPGGGTIEVINTGETYGLTLIRPDTDMNQVTIKSADAEDPAVFHLVRLEGVRNVTFDSIEVDSSEANNAEWLTDLRIVWSNNITFQNSYFHSTADGFLEKSADKAESLAVIEGGRGFEFINNTVEGYHHGLQLFDVRDTVIKGNDIFRIEGDGIRMGGVQNMTIADNYIHDFYGTNQSVTHSDMIQIWGTNADILTSNVVITGNILDAGNGAATQGIFIRNEQSQTDGPLGQDYQGITITDNIVYNGHQHGIYVADATDILIADNTVLWDRDAFMTFGDNDPQSGSPEIEVFYSGTATITGNITPAITTKYVDDLNTNGNQTITYGNSLNSNYVGHHFVNGLTPGTNDLRDLQLRPESEWNGKFGSHMSWASSNTDEDFEAVMRVTENPADRFEYVLDAALSVDQDGYAGANEYTYRWTFQDGSVKTGQQIKHTFDDAGLEEVTLSVFRNGKLIDEIDRAIGVRPKDIFEFDFENGVEDLSDNDAVTDIVGKTVLVAGKDGGQALQIGSGNKLEIEDRSGNLDGLEQFGLALDVRAIGRNDMLLRMQDSYKVFVEDDGVLSFEIVTGDGTFSIKSDEPIFDNDDWVRVGFAYDAYEGKMAIYADGEEVASGEASGIIKNTSHDLYFTHKDYNGMQAQIDNVVMSRDPSVAGLESTALVAPPPPAPAPAPPPVVDVGPPTADEPVVESPPAQEPVQDQAPEEPPVAEAPEEPPVAEAPEDDTPTEPGVWPTVPDMPDTGNDDDDGGSGGFLSFLFDLIAALFGGGRSSKKTAAQSEIQETTGQDVFVLADVVPLTEPLDEALPDASGRDNEDDEIDFAA